MNLSAHHKLVFGEGLCILHDKYKGVSLRSWPPRSPESWHHLFQQLECMESVETRGLQTRPVTSCQTLIPILDFRIPKFNWLTKLEWESAQHFLERRSAVHVVHTAALAHFRFWGAKWTMDVSAVRCWWRYTSKKVTTFRKMHVRGNKSERVWIKEMKAGALTTLKMASSPQMNMHLHRTNCDAENLWHCGCSCRLTRSAVIGSITLHPIMTKGLMESIWKLSYHIRRDIASMPAAAQSHCRSLLSTSSIMLPSLACVDCSNQVLAWDIKR